MENDYCFCGIEATISINEIRKIKATKIHTHLFTVWIGTDRKIYCADNAWLRWRKIERKEWEKYNGNTEIVYGIVHSFEGCMGKTEHELRIFESMDEYKKLEQSYVDSANYIKNTNPDDVCSLLSCETLEFVSKGYTKPHLNERKTIMELPFFDIGLHFKEVEELAEDWLRLFPKYDLFSPLVKAVALDCLEEIINEYMKQCLGTRRKN